MRKYFLLLGVFALFSFSETSLKKRISDEYFRYEFFTTDKDITPKEGKTYYWFKGGTIHSSEHGVGGELLQDDFLKYYHSNQLAEAGKYKKGLREGYWKTWFENGTLQSKTYYDDGQKDGSYFAYDKTGFLTETGTYKNSLKHGRWINFINKDTLKYREGKVVVKKVKPVKDTLQPANGKPGFIKRVFYKKDNKNKVAVQENSANQKKPGFFKRIFKKKDAPINDTAEVKAVQQAETVKQRKEKKPGFFKRLFSKKNKENQNNG
ncbi:hypothetical protein FMM05_02580 [Flavobacterium zepuense]|uniref:MORN repeat variant n=1 Tax=Flavobacterium zepuense TaxID=2593302 RepID=A0A552VAP1_9FLAO|nr:hypothetical protein [Flavobacterium zepuense]TRW27544.1 hypothetical protein FMM05_02580 [Flavobacterium zepuense]